jgi:hypothetical protein
LLVGWIVKKSGRGSLFQIASTITSIAGLTTGKKQDSSAPNATTAFWEFTPHFARVFRRIGKLDLTSGCNWAAGF